MRAETQHGNQIRIHTVPQGGPLPLLPGLGAQRSHEVSQPIRAHRGWSIGTNAALHARRPGHSFPGLHMNEGWHISKRTRANATKTPRAFLTKSYPTMKKHNPSIPIMLRSAEGTLPKVYARYEFGQEKSHSLEGKAPPRSSSRQFLATGPEAGHRGARCGYRKMG